MRKIFKFLAVVFVLLICLVIIACFVITSSIGLKNIVFPIVEKSAGIIINAEQVSLSIISGEVELNKFNVSMPEEFSGKGELLQGKVDIKELLRGRFKLDNVLLKNSNLAICSTSDEKREQANINDAGIDENSDSSSFSLRVTNLSIENFNLEYTLEGKNKTSPILLLNNVNLKLDEFELGKLSSLLFDSEITFNNRARKKVIKGYLKGNVQTKLDEQFLPLLIGIDSEYRSANGEKANIDLKFSSIEQDNTSRWPFELNLSILNLTLKPIASMFLDEKSHYCNAQLKEFKVTAQGEDLYNIDMQKNINATLQCDLENIKAKALSEETEQSLHVDDIKISLDISDFLNSNYKISNLILNNVYYKLCILDNAKKEKDKPAKSNSFSDSTKKVNDHIVKIGLPEKIFNFDFNNIEFNNLNFIAKIERRDSEHTSVTKISKFNLSLPKFKAGKLSKGKYCGELVFNNGKGNKELNGAFKGHFNLKILNNLLPESIEIVHKDTFEDHESDIHTVFKSNVKTTTGEIPYNLKVNLLNLRLLPIFKTFLEGAYTKSKGSINKLTLDVKGSDLQLIDYKKNLEGMLKCNFENIEIPVGLVRYAVFKVLFLPLEIVANINSYTETNIVPQILENAFKTANELGDKIRNLHFETGELELKYSKNEVNIEKCLFRGGVTNTIRRIEIDGDVNLEGRVNLETKTSFVGVVFPVQITGTMDKPTPELLRVLPGVVLDTAGNFVVSGVDFTKDVGETSINLGRKTVSTGVETVKKGTDITKKALETTIDVGSNATETGIQLGKNVSSKIKATGENVKKGIKNTTRDILDLPNTFRNSIKSVLSDNENTEN